MYIHYVHTYVQLWDTLLVLMMQHHDVVIILLLISILQKHEIERLSAWHNPTASAEYNLPGVCMCSYGYIQLYDINVHLDIRMHWICTICFLCVFKYM